MNNNYKILIIIKNIIIKFLIIFNNNFNKVLKLELKLNKIFLIKIFRNGVMNFILQKKFNSIKLNQKMMIIYINLKIYKLLKILIIKQLINLLKILKLNNKNKNKKDFFKKKVFIEFIIKLFSIIIYIIKLYLKSLIMDVKI